MTKEQVKARKEAQVRDRFPRATRLLSCCRTQPACTATPCVGSRDGRTVGLISGHSSSSVAQLTASLELALAWGWKWAWPCRVCLPSPGGSDWWWRRCVGGLLWSTVLTCSLLLSRTPFLPEFGGCRLPAVLTFPGLSPWHSHWTSHPHLRSHASHLARQLRVPGNTRLP